MTKYINKIIASGRLTRDAELKFTKSGQQLLKFSIAVNRSYKDNRETMYLDCVIWGPRGEQLVSRLTKGLTVVVDGRLTVDEWINTEGSKVRSYFITCDNVAMYRLSKDRKPIGDDENDDDNHDDDEYDNELVVTAEDIEF